MYYAIESDLPRHSHHRHSRRCGARCNLLHGGATPARVERQPAARRIFCGHYIDGRPFRLALHRGDGEVMQGIRQMSDDLHARSEAHARGEARLAPMTSCTISVVLLAVALC